MHKHAAGGDVTCASVFYNLLFMIENTQWVGIEATVGARGRIRFWFGVRVRIRVMAGVRIEDTTRIKSVQTASPLCHKSK